MGPESLQQSVLNEYPNPGRPAADSVENVATTPEKFSENVASSHLSVASPAGFHGDDSDSEEASSSPHGLTAWVRRKKKPGEDPNALHLEEQLELDLARFYRLTTGNTGPSAAVASHIRSFESIPAGRLQLVSEL